MNDSTLVASARALPPVSIDQGSAVTLSAGSVDLTLRLTSGQLWLTRSRPGLATRPQRQRAELALAPSDLPGCDPEDVWLRAGETLRLPRGSSWVAQAWPSARFTTLA